MASENSTRKTKIGVWYLKHGSLLISIVYLALAITHMPFFKACLVTTASIIILLIVNRFIKSISKNISGKHHLSIFSMSLIFYAAPPVLIILFAFYLVDPLKNHDLILLSFLGFWQFFYGVHQMLNIELERS